MSILELSLTIMRKIRGKNVVRSALPVLESTSNASLDIGCVAVEGGAVCCFFCWRDEISSAFPLIFLHDRQRQFQNAHKLFGVSKITKIIKNFNPPEKDIVMHTIVFQSDTQANDSVGGCYRIIQELPHQIEYSQAELKLVLHQLAICQT
ncbi:hypothetical protein Goshw_025468 [Gossypium schwendimanii]|uniref:LOB domain-containing protein n=1 Tax=Gossypium schwendimanii TaxID=34291 RepID=A0A7J9KZ76_GOSSC|nr:hypothetical protein [Gossypium schwendimanii]